MRKVYVQVNGELYEKGTEPQSGAPMVMDDIQPYQSMIDGSWITSRSQHKAHLRQHGCIEIGNEKFTPRQGIPDVAPQERKELIRAQVDAMSHREFKLAIKRDVDRVKWNSRED